MYCFYSPIGVARIATQLHQTENTISFIAEALMKPNDYDYRCEFSKPVFRQEVTDINSITPGLVMTGNYCSAARNSNAYIGYIEKLASASYCIAENNAG